MVDLARLTLERDWHVRFIELMPLGGGECASLSIKRYVSNIETRRRIEAVLGPMTEVSSSNPSDEARNYGLPNARGVIGFISPVSEPYCGTCNRMRLTADGKFHLCLLNDDELDVRKALRAGSGDGGLAAIAQILTRAVRAQAHRASSARRPLDPGPLDVPNRRLVSTKSDGTISIPRFVDRLTAGSDYRWPRTASHPGGATGSAVLTGGRAHS